MSGNQGEALAPDQPASVSGLVSTLAPTAVVAGIYVVIFLVLRKSQRRYYAPRTYLGSLRDNERSPALPNTLFGWVGEFFKIPDNHVLQHQSLDAYLFLRFLRMIVVIAFVGCCITWPVLFPVNATGGGGYQQLEILSYANVNTGTSAGQGRLYAHTFIAWIFYGFVMYMIVRESIFYVNLRQAFLLSPLYANRISSRTVLFASVPDRYLDEGLLRKVFGDSVKNIWITQNTDDVDKLVEERDKVAMRLEKAEVKLIKMANAARTKGIKKGDVTDDADLAVADAEQGSIAARWVPEKKRPTHKTGFLGLVGKKVDTINWCRAELERLVPATVKAQEAYRSGSPKKIPAVFVEFTTQAAAESARQVLAHHQALQMSPKYIGVRPDEVVWSALKISWWQRVVRRFAVVGFISVLIIYWAVPVAVVGIISNVDSLKQIFFLTWLNQIPPVIMGVVQGLLPSVLLSVLMSLVPVIMRLCAKLSGEPSLSRVELFTQNAYFAFQVIQVFLITTMTSSASATATAIAQDPSKVTELLAANIPKSANFYISYFIVQGLTIASGVISQVVGFFIFTLMYKYLAGTPRAMYQKWANLSAISWGSTLPVYTNIAVISLVFAPIQPLVLGFATVGLSLFYLAYRYNILFVTDTQVDTRGLIYPRALKQLFAGIYIAELCMVGMFAVSAAIGPAILMVVFLIFTILFHKTINSAIDPLLYNLPMTLESEEQHLLQQEPSEASNGEKKSTDKGTPVEDLSPKKVPGMIAKFFKPWAYCDYHTLRRLVPQDAADVDHMYTDEIERNAYYPPAVGSEAPLLWIPEDKMGISKQEIRDTSKVIPITDEGCILNDQNKLEWDTESVRPPVWQEKIYY